ncbi:aldo/keto reductase [Flavisolibacter ginsengisoli]|jgi:aryl-alcohol dehydrogenase-like predicted oxidoreductase|uniref:Predicted oxidoreductase n=1 Tax=Flavisolibacter ginsengisoli DSM 18119 TaxID=1121884 RepID=A0A1M4VG12_9BACT|nr:aldo/keto reductase [Flavisolibacter ginsengisoli]SHE67773.1 Predicted oxidoreductase [Flavisolibacter ginsengisoli DSM 18119]
MQAINKIILGTVQFGLSYGINNNAGKPSYEEVTKILDKAYDFGISTLDTAAAYGDAIDIIGKYHSEREHRFAIVNKFHVDNNDFNLESIVQHNLQRLQIKSYRAYLFHSFSDYLIHKNLIQNLLKLKERGALERIGVSVYTNEELESLLTEPGIDLIQLPYNLLDNDSLRGYWLMQAKQKGILLHVRSVFLQGLFFKLIDSFPSILQPLTPHIKKLEAIAKEAGTNIAALALQYVLQNTLVDGVLIGVDSLNQLQNNIDLLQHSIDKNVFSEVNKISVKEKQLLNPVNWI